MSKAVRDLETSIRSTVLKSGFSGVAASAVVAVLASPIGLGGLIGVSAAGDLGPRRHDANDAFPAAPPPLTDGELRGIQTQLDDSTASIDAARAQTDDVIARMEAIASHRNAMRTASLGGPGFDAYAELAALFLGDDA